MALHSLEQTGTLVSIIPGSARGTAVGESHMTVTAFGRSIGIWRMQRSEPWGWISGLLISLSGPTGQYLSLKLIAHRELKRAPLTHTPQLSSAGQKGLSDADNRRTHCLSPGNPAATN